MTRARRILVAVVALAGSLPLSSVARAANGLSDEARIDGDIVAVENGRLRGFVSGETIHFRGIPYAASPVGDGRFAPPAPPETWSSVRDATRFGAPCPQDKATDEDCLRLNVTAPRGARRGERRPVMVWLHGGGFSVGSANTYDASEMVAQGDVVFVGVDFRLGVFGLLAFPGLHGSGSQILLDQQAALRWIRHNVAAFGGDPDNVTLFGQSGGGIGVCAQLTSPASRGLFHKAILQSGSCSTSFAADFVSRGTPAGRYLEPITAQQAKGEALARQAGCDAADPVDRLACLRRLKAETLLALSAPFVSAAYGTPPLPTDPRRALADEREPRVPILTGFTRNEGLAMVAGMQLTGTPVTPAEYPHLVAAGFAERSSAVLARYPLSNYGGRGDLAWAAIVTDRMFACPQLRDARELAKRGPVYAYRFSDPNGVGLIPTPPGLPHGPSHTSELPLLFRMTDGPVDIGTGQIIERSPAQSRLSAEMIAAWTHFARTGDPNRAGGRSWPRFTPHAGSALAEFGERLDPVSAEAAHAQHHCALWDPIVEQ